MSAGFDRARRLARTERHIVVWTLTMAVSLSAATMASAQQRGGERATEGQIKTAITRGANFVRSQLGMFNEGRLGLAVMTLLKSGESVDAPELKSALDRIASRVNSGGQWVPSSDQLYDAAVNLIALATANPEKYKREIQAIADYILSYQEADGQWDYPNNRSGGDTSISQYAILALWEAKRAGIKIPTRVWDKAASWHITRQLPDGSFTYHPGMYANGRGTFSPGTYTMTAAGTASLLVARMHLYPDAKDVDADEDKSVKGKRKGKRFGVLESAATDAEEPDPAREAAERDANYKPTVRLASIDKAVARGRQWLENRFSVRPDTSWGLYYLYCIERLAALANTETFAQHDWYAEGAYHLVISQQQLGNTGDQGRWNDQSGDGPATCFGILFLTKATEKALGRKPSRIPKFGGGLLVGGRGLPENLGEVQLDKGGIKVRKLKGAVDELLAELENAKSDKVESAQAALLDQVLTEDPEALIGKKDRLLKLARDPRPEVRRTAFWALGRTNDLRVVPTLIEGLKDADLACLIEARNALRFISKRINDSEFSEEPTEPERAAAIVLWKKWYQNVRPYDERDDLGDPAPK